MLPFEVTKEELDEEQEVVKVKNYYTVRFTAYKPHQDYKEETPELESLVTEIVFEEDLNSALALIKAVLTHPNTNAKITYTYE